MRPITNLERVSDLAQSERALVLGLGEHVADAANRDDAARLFRIVLDRRPDARDMHVDGTVERLDLLALDRVHQRIARHHPAGMLRERQQQGELITGQWTRRAVEPHLAGSAVDLEPPMAQHVGRWLAPWSAAWLAPWPGAASAQDRAQPSQQFTWFKRLRQVIVGAH